MIGRVGMGAHCLYIRGSWSRSSSVGAFKSIGSMGELSISVVSAYNVGTLGSFPTTPIS